MSCATINFGIPKQCNDGKSGVLIAYWTPTENIASMSVDVSGQVTGLALASGKSFYTINLDKESGLWKEDLTQNLPTGSPMWVQAFTFNYRKNAVNQRHFLQTAANTNGVTFLLRDYNGNIILMGATGAFLTGDATTSGQKKGEMNGSALTFTANEDDKAYYVPSSIFGTLSLVNG